MLILRLLPAFSIAQSVICVVFLIVISILLKYVLSRRYWSQYLPGMSMSILDLWGDVKNFQKHKPSKYANCFNAYFLQTFTAYSQLFRSKMLFSFWFSHVPFIVVMKAEAVEQLIAGTKNMEKSWAYRWIHPWLNAGLLTSHGQKWKSRRKLLTPSFHFEILKDFLPVFNEQSQILVNIFKKQTQSEWTDITTPVTMCTLDIICETTLGVSVNAQKNSESEYVQAVLSVSSVVMHRMENPLYFVDWIFYNSKPGREFIRDVKTLHNFTRSVISQKKAKLQEEGKLPAGKRKALMDLLLVHHLQNEDLSEEDIREEIDTFTFEGHDTTSMGINWALYLIGLHKDVQDNIHEELDRIFGDDVERLITTDDLKDMEYLDRVLKESQRLYPSVPLIGRTSSPGTTLNGYKIPEGTACIVFTYELHRDPSVYPNPEKFDPDRFLPENTLNRHPFAYIPFSAGPRNCIGQRFAVMEEKIVVANILRNFKLESLESRDEVVPAAELILRNTHPLKIRIRNRK